MYKFIFSIILIFTTGCSYIPHPRYKQEQLYHFLLSLDNHISKIEAQKLSKYIISFSTKLKQTYKPIIEPHFNNLLVNIGLKAHGLCYEWSDALYLHLSKQNYPNFTFHLIVSNKGKYWSEHNAFAITSHNNPISKGIIIDLWRDINDIYINYISKDDTYQWDTRQQRELCISPIPR